MTATPPGRQRFPIRIERSWRPFVRLWGATPANSYVELTDDHLFARFGWSRLHTAITNIEGYSLTGPYRWWSAIGVRRSVRNGDASFCGTARGGVCLRFRERVHWARIFDPPALTVTPEDMDGFVRALEARGITGDDRRKRHR